MNTMPKDRFAGSWLPAMLGMATVICSIMIAASHFLELHLGDAAADPYDVEARQASFTPLRPFVVMEEMAGWRASRPVGASEMDELEYSLARYALVPTLLCGHADKKLIVTNFDCDEELNAAIRRNDYKLVVRVAPGRAVVRRRQ